MNMKFMRFSKLKGDGGDGDGTTMEQEAKPVVLNEASNAGPKGFHDNSEWFAPEAGKNESNHKKRVVKLGRLAGGTTAVVQNLGFTTLKMNERSTLYTNNIGRKFHGDSTSQIDDNQEAIKKDGEVTEKGRKKSNDDDDDDDDDDYELDKIFKENMRKRRLEEGNSSKSKPKGTKKNKNTNKKRKKNSGRR